MATISAGSVVSSLYGINPADNSLYDKSVDDLLLELKMDQILLSDY